MHESMIEFPVYLIDQDNWMILINYENGLEYHLETIDIEENEYSGWDSKGQQGGIPAIPPIPIKSAASQGCYPTDYKSG
ncbi:MAG: hypothetical protein ABIE07_01745 [Candidatus Zixiibacteriota bacterium]